MSFRARLTLFFILIVVVPMAAMGVMAFWLINGSTAGKADARAAGAASAVRTVYESSSRTASLRARTAARELALTPPSQLHARAQDVARRAGLARLTVSIGGHAAVVSVGSATAVAPGIAVVRPSGARARRTFEASTLTAAAFVREVSGHDIAVVVRRGGQTVAASEPAAAHLTLPGTQGTVTVRGQRYRVITERLPGFGGRDVTVSVLSGLAATDGTVTRDRVYAIAFIGGFLLIAFLLALLVSRALQQQVAHFLKAARRLGNLDFSEPVPTIGRDEFAALGQQFNSMSEQLRNRMHELELERDRFRTSVRRIGEAFASGLNREALLELALRTAIDATQSDRGRVSARADGDEPLVPAEQVGALAELEQPFADAEQRAVESGDLGEASCGDAHVAAVALGPTRSGDPVHGVITVSREGRRFTADDLELLRSLASRATLALTNVNTHIDVARQAVTDDLTGLASRGHFEELLEAEMREVARYGHPVSIAMFDIDNFKSVNDTYGHPQGDLLLRRVAEALRATCREADVPARYGGEEMALILPHTDLEGAYELAERARRAVEGLAIPRLDHQGWLKITTSVGVAASVDGGGEALISAADAALYAAKRAGKNRTVRADADTFALSTARELARSAEPPSGE